MAVAKQIGDDQLFRWGLENLPGRFDPPLGWGWTLYYHVEAMGHYWDSDPFRCTIFASSSFSIFDLWSRSWFIILERESDGGAIFRPRLLNQQYCSPQSSLHPYPSEVVGYPQTNGGSIL